MQHLMTDDAFIEDANGCRTGPYRTAFGGNKIAIYDAQATISDNDVVIQPLSNGNEVRFIAVNVQFNSGIGGIPASYIIDIVKEEKRNQEKAMAGNTTYNITASNVQVGDGNTQNIIDAFRDLSAKVEQSDATPQEKGQAKNLIADLLANPTVAAVLGGTVSGIL